MRFRAGGRAAAAGVVAAALSSGCLWADVGYLAADSLNGRNNGTAGSQLARDHILDELRPIAVGADSGATGDAAYLQPFPGGVNIVAVIPGTDLAHEYVVVGAHYDHHATCRVIDPSDRICNGATDNATGVAAVLGIARDVAAEPARRSVVVALWDREEDGLLGSRHYVSNPLVPLADTVAYVNFDIVGANLRPFAAHHTFAIGAETGGDVLSGIVDAAAADTALAEVVVSAPLGQYRSDYASFLEGAVPSVFFSDSTGPCYHTTEDEFAVVDFDKLQIQVATGLRVTRELADGDVRPPFVPTPTLVTYADVAALAPVAAEALAATSPSAPEWAVLDSTSTLLQHHVALGAEAFASADLGPVVQALLTLVESLREGPCDGFLG